MCRQQYARPRPKILKNTKVNKRIILIHKVIKFRNNGKRGYYKV